MLEPRNGDLVRKWLPRELKADVRFSGASPGGHIDCATWPEGMVERLVALAYHAVEEPEALGVIYLE